MTPDQAEGLRTWARGDLAREAGAELLIRSRVLAGKVDSWLFSHDQDPEVPTGMVWPDVDGYSAANEGYLSSGERKVWGVVYTLLHPEGRGRVDLANLQGIDTYDSLLIVAAVSHCMGLHERGHGVGLGVPWP